MACEHQGKIHRGYEKGYDLAWCADCGVITWCSDGLTPRGAEVSTDHSDWVEQHVVAFGCHDESHGVKACDEWCGSRHCPATIKETK